MQFSLTKIKIRLSARNTIGFRSICTNGRIWIAENNDKEDHRHLGEIFYFQKCCRKKNCLCNEIQNCQSSLECYSGFHLFCILSLVLAAGQRYFKLTQLFPVSPHLRSKNKYSKSATKVNLNKMKCGIAA